MKVYEVFLGYACDEKCLFCSQETAWRRQPAQKLPDVAKSIYTAYQNGCRALVLNGGEPTLHKDFLQVVAVGRRTGFKEIHIQTNGLRLADRAFTEEAVRAGVTLVRISLHGDTPELHDQQVGVPGALAKALEGIAHLKRLGVPVGVNVVVNRLNVEALPKVFAFFLDEVGIKDFGLIYPLYEGDMAANAGRAKVSMTEAAPHIRAAFDVFRERGAEPPFLLNLTPCALPGYEGRVLRWSSTSAAIYDAAGTMIIDPEEYTLDQPGGAKKTLDSDNRQGRRQVSACATCVYADRCLGVETRYLETFGEEEFAPLAAAPPPFDARWPGAASWRRILTEEERRALRRQPA